MLGKTGGLKKIIKFLNFKLLGFGNDKNAT